MKFTTATAAITLGFLASNASAVSVTQIMKSGSTNDLNIQTDGTCIDLFQGTYGARLNHPTAGTNCLFWVDSGCSGKPIGTVTKDKPEADLPDGANGIECFIAGQ
ncbi:hypothetical protein BJY04DRAFT_80111 [Aspergillus karnatakaensis]|uniref:uncharacterized protein n=1 Tax=Aspergillus karnatakaensis TaxID=1810916 RepID=UPI003CCE5238